MHARRAAALGRALAARGWTLAAAESCTGGLLGACLTQTPGSSVYFRGGVVAYANAVKTALLDVRPATLARAGAVSAAVAAQMAAGVARRLGADLGVAITGVAGPGGGTAAKPVGTVVVAVAQGRRRRVRIDRWRGGRARIREQAAGAALDMVLEWVNAADAPARGVRQGGQDGEKKR